MTVKKYLNDVLENLLNPIRQRRAEYANDKAQVLQMLKDGTDKARETTSQTLKEVKEAMGINYLN